jgi:hypothetical protein
VIALDQKPSAAVLILGGKVYLKQWEEEQVAIYLP